MKRICKEFFIRCYVRDSLNGNSDTGLLKFTEGFSEAGWSLTNEIKKAKKFKTRREALSTIKKIIKEKTSNSLDPTYPPNNIHVIGRKCLGIHVDEIEFRLSVVEVNVSKVEMKEYDYFCGTVSFFKPDIQINEVKTFEKKIK